MGEYSAYLGRNTHGPDATANAIILKRNYPGNEHLAFLIVEGETDRTFYRNFINKAKCQISVAHNKSAVIQVVAILEKEVFSGFLATVDADFDILEGKSPPSQNVLFTDVHDIEMMILKSGALEKVLGEFGAEEKIDKHQNDGKDVRTMLLECSVPLGYLRLISVRESLSLKFEGLDFADFVDRETLKLDLSKLLRAVKGRSQRQDIADKQLLASIQGLKRDTYDIWHLCSGHDVISVLSVGLRKAIGSWNANDVKLEILERNLRLAFERAHFQETRLYALIQQWEKDN